MSTDMTQVESLAEGEAWAGFKQPGTRLLLQG